MHVGASDPRVSGINMDSLLTSSTSGSSSQLTFPFLSVFKDGKLRESLLLDHEKDRYLLLGRHTNCDIILHHSSISRHHLEIQVLHASQELVLIDLNSVHGTWVNGTQLQPLKRVKAKEGDAFRLGTSSRAYVFQWLPFPPTYLSTEDASSSEEDSKFCPILPFSSIADPNHNQAHTVSIHNHAYKDVTVKLIRSTQGVQPPIFIPENNDEHEIIDEMERVTVTAPETKNSTEVEIRNGNVYTPGNNKKQHEDRIHVKNNLSRLWLRRTNLNPPPRLSTSKLDAPNTIENSNSMNHVAPSAPPLPSCYSINDVVSPSAPPLLVTTDNVTPSTDDHQEFPDHEIFDHSLYKDHINNSVNITKDIQTDLLDVDYKPAHREILPEMRQNVLMEGYLSDKENDNCGGVNYTKSSHGNVKYRRASNKVFTECTNKKKEHLEEDMETCVSDKENQAPASQSNLESKGNAGVLRSSGIPMDGTQHCRVPFQCLPFPASTPPTPSLNYRFTSTNQESREIGSSAMMKHAVDNFTVQKKILPGISSRSEPRRLWHIVIDLSCFVDSESFKAVRLLEGIREVRLIVPKIVISELDCFRAGSEKAQKKALKWIESCMVYLPSWIHVQSSSECMMAATPPASPCVQDCHSGGNFNGDLLSPTNADHVLNCAILFSTVISHGKVALLTNDTALRIKAMAEGLVCEVPPVFCKSLVSPYSDRFLWSGSLAHGYNKLSEKAWHVKSTSALAPSVITSSSGSNNKHATIFMDTVRAMATYTTPHHHAVESLNKQCNKQAKGLKLVLT